MKLLKKMWTRIRNKKVFMAVASGILLILVNLNVIDAAIVENYESTINTALSILVALGVFSDPESHVRE